MRSSYHAVQASVLVAVLGCGPSVGDADGHEDATGANTAPDGSATASPSTSGASQPSDASAGADITSITDDSGNTVFDVGSTDLMTDRCVASEICSLPGDAFAEVSGTTPLGELTGAFAWSGLAHGECSGTSIAIVASLEEFETDVVCEPGFDMADPSIYLFLRGLVGEDCVVDKRLTVMHTVDGESVETTPQLELTHCEPLDSDGNGRLEGSFTALAEGWNISGSFVAPRCVALDIACP